jgi:beta-aspartyl-peptidase (threonine type)
MNMLKMNRLFLFFLLVLFSCDSPEPSSNAALGTASKTPAERQDYALAIHGGAGTIKKENLSAEKEKLIRAKLDSALSIGEELLKKGSSSLDAVVAVVAYLEDQPEFNAGKGAVFSYEGRNELDAAIMDGQTMNAGAVGGLTIIKNPVKAARAVMEKSRHVLLTGEGANEFARSQGLEVVAPDYFFTERRWKALDEGRRRELEQQKKRSGDLQLDPEHKYGTVGAVALDQSGNLAAATSTGGMTNKRYGRFGDVPIIGAGTYADNNTCAVSCTGHGEYFIRYAVAHDLSARIAYSGKNLKEAADEIIYGVLKEAGGGGGLIALDKNGNVSLPFNTAGMYRGFVQPGKRYVGIFEGE